MATTPNLTERLNDIIGLLRRTLLWLFVFVFIVLVGIICYVIFCYNDTSIAFRIVIFGGGTLMIICALYWLGFACKRLLEFQNSCRKQLIETELSLYRESIRREGLLKDEQITIAQLDLRLESKRKEIELAKLEKELNSVKGTIN